MNRAQTARRVTGTPTDWEARAVGLALAALVLAIGGQPVADPGLWWELSRGRAVLEGTVTPAQSLCAGPVASEADWLGGVPWLLAFLAGGPMAFTIVRLIGTALVARAVWKSEASLTERATLAALMMFGLAPAIEPGERWADSLAGLVLFWVGRNLTTRRQAGLCFALGIFWANLGPHSALLLLFAMMLGWQHRAWRTGLLCSLAAVVGLSLTPRGPLGIVDSCRLLAPWLQLTPGELLASEWPPLWGTTETAALLGWFGCSVVVLRRCWVMESPGRSAAAAGWCLLQTAIVWNATLIPVLLPWLWAMLPKATAAPSRRRGEAVILTLGLAGLAWLQAAGGWPGQTTRLGWGIAEQLEPRQLTEAIPASASGTIFAPDLRTAGIGAWGAPPTLKIWQTPRQALLNGTWRAERDRMQELRMGWELQRPRGDGTPGGWWIPLLDRQTTLLLIPAEDRLTLHSFEPKLWKPLLLDAPIIPYAFSGTAWATPGILQTLQQRDFVEAGSWHYQPPSPWGNDWSVDLWGGLTGRPAFLPMRRQIAIFTALGLPTAAARMIHGLRRVQPDSFVHELAEVQRDLAELERHWLGRSPTFRELVRTRLSGEAGPTEPALAAAVMAYIQQGPQAAAEVWPAGDPWRPFWQARLAAEAGDVTATRAALLELQQSDDPLRRGLAHDLLERLPAGGPP